VGLRVLVVEDDDDWREIISQLFKNQGSTVATAGTFAVAEQLLRTETFDIVTLDMWLAQEEVGFSSVGVSGGWRLLELIAQRHPETSIFVIAGGFDTDPTYAYHLGRRGVKDLATKRSFQPEKIAEWLKIASRDAGSPEQQSQNDAG
jgi:DNA-binding NtrC family response regulator